MKYLTFSKEDSHYVASALIVTTAMFSLFTYVVQANANAVTLNATVASALTFVTSTNDIGSVTPGTIAYGTTTLDVATNSTAGWFVTLSGDNKNTSNNNLQLTGQTSVQISDQTEWVPGSGTTTGGNAVVVGSLANSGNVLAFRVMSASSSNGVAFLSTGWWGTNDGAAAKWAGIASTTGGPRTIGNAGTGSYSSSNHLNSVQYYLKVAATQQTGAYSAALTYTATAN